MQIHEGGYRDRVRAARVCARQPRHAYDSGAAGQSPLFPVAWPSSGADHRRRAVWRRDESRSRVTRLARAAGKEVVTSEGLSPEVLRPLQQAWIAEDVPQCGYCQSGQIMAAAILLRENSNPSAADVDDCMTGNICRCGTYQRIRRAIRLAAKMKAEGGAK